jgi:hypothetical protein
MILALLVGALVLFCRFGAVTELSRAQGKEALRIPAEPILGRAGRLLFHFFRRKPDCLFLQR